MIGTVLDKYEVLQKVGEGGMATVYRGRHTTLHRDVAIKVLHPHLSSSVRNRRRFAREARAIEQLRHPNILEIFDYSGNDAEDCYIVTEFVQGETLAEVLHRRGVLPSELVAILGSHVGRALAFAHKSAVLHRDLKPDNVMLRSDGTIKLMDFGIARFLDEAQVTMTGALVGSPAYMSPEQARELPLDARSDLFSLGSMLFQLVTGSLPFAGSNPSIILRNVIEGNRSSVNELAPKMSASLADVVERLLQRDPADRYNSADEVVAALEAVTAEVELDPELPQWSAAAFLDDPDAWERRLDGHLRSVLLAQGKAYLAASDPLAALRLFNRLLSIDEQNEEVLSLVQGLHVEPEPRERPRPFALASLSVVLIAALVLPLGLGVLSIANADQRASELGLPRMPDAGAAPIGSSVTALSHTPLSGGFLAPIPMPADPELPPEVVATPGDPAPSPSPVGAQPEPPPEGPRRNNRPPSRGAVAERAALEAAPLATPLGPDTRPGTVVFLTEGMVWADVYCDGNSRRIARTRGDDSRAELSPGVHDCVYRSDSDLMYEEPVRVEVAPGSHQEKKIRPRLKPRVVALDPACPAACEVRIDGNLAGTAGALGGSVSIEDRPDMPHELTISCGSQVWAKASYRPGGRMGPVACVEP